jgi:hypothetical protein
VIAGAATGATRYEFENQTALLTLQTTGIFYPVWNHAGTQIAYYTVTSDGSGSEVHIYDLNSSSDWAIAWPADYPRAGYDLAFSPDDSAVYFVENVPGTDIGGGVPGREETFLSRASVVVPGTIDHGFLRVTDILPGKIGQVGFPTMIPSDGAGSAPKLFVTIITAEAGYPITEGIYVLGLDAQGAPVLPGANVAASSVSSPWLVLDATPSPTGTQLLVRHPVTNQDNDIYVLDGIGEILEGSAPPITNFPWDPRVRPVETGPRFSTAPSWSEDGTLIYFTDDANGTWDATNPWGTLPLAQFDPMVAVLSEVLAWNASPVRVPGPTQNGQLRASPGGTRLVSVDVSFVGATVDSVHLLAATWRISDEIDLGLSGVAQSDFTLADGSGTTLFVPAGTQVGNIGTGLQEISVFTPLLPGQENQLPGFVSGVPVVRDFGPNGTTFSPPAQLTLSYTDAEIAGLFEHNLRVYKLNDATGKFDIELPVVERDLLNNTITVAVADFSTYGVGGQFANVPTGVSWLIVTAVLLAAGLAEHRKSVASRCGLPLREKR